ncbi:uncharacterized protein LOC120623945 [Pararge aegeria]|uniref:uncharacterized protein LOC120623945 n=1 Tax=Pararge aegeria TaxID=116150 RepID=UPI0019D2A948|nr:uncharacterized protein LOC120623945 [Pararge aegeria]
MEHHNVHTTLKNGERVTSTYAEIYFNDSYCYPRNYNVLKHETLHHKDNDHKDEWVSPSDLLIGMVELKPPFTSKFTRGKTHEGILMIGNGILDKERASFLGSMTTLMEDNDAAWKDIMINEKHEVVKKVKAIFLDIFKYKSEIMKQEVSKFYEHSLQDLEIHLRSEIQTVIQCARANIVSDLNSKIQQNLQREKRKLVDVLAKKYITERQKIKKYYKTLLDNELCRNNTLINKAFHERNDAVKAFYKQVESKRLTSTMYIMSLERKKCQMKKIVLENLQSVELTEKLKKIKDKKEEIDAFKKKDVRMAEINKQWEEKIKKVLILFLKFISFSLKLLPEQTTFLLDLEKMFVLQLNEIQKNPEVISTVLFEEKEQLNIFEFPTPEQEITVCEEEPFVLVGDLLAEFAEPHYGSRETLPSDIDLPYFRFNRKYFYAKCHGYESIKKFLISQSCKCSLAIEADFFKPLTGLEPKNVGVTLKPEPLAKESKANGNESSTESLLIEDYLRLHECPVRKCCDWIKRNTFPYLASYLDYNEENFNRVTAILGEIPDKAALPVLISVQDIEENELPFAATKESHHTVATQYSSQDDLTLDEIKCSCFGNAVVKHTESHYILKSSSSKALHDILLKRKISLQRLMDTNPNLLKIFTDECFDYKM